jgi:squalene-associated FAD-dependent desaturase
MASSPGVVILGGGFAGLSCAAALAEVGIKAVVIEKKPHLGGRAYSFTDAATGHSVDNGQHLFMGCYEQTRRFLDRVGAAGRLRFLSPIRVDFAEVGGSRDVLSCPELLGSPLHLAWGVLGLKGITWKDKRGLMALDKALRRERRKSAPGEGLDDLTVRQWLDSLGQSPLIQKRLFDPIALGTLNDDPAVAAATGFVQAMTRMFYDSVEGARLGLSTVGLSELYTTSARQFLEARGGRVLLSSKVSGVAQDDGGGLDVRLESGEPLRAEHVVSTLPPWDLKRLELPAALRGSWETLAPSPIVSIYLWLDRPVLNDEPLVGMLGTDVHWVFNKGRILGHAEGPGQYLSLVISGARRQVGLAPKELLDLAMGDLRRCFPAAQKATITGWKVVKEPFATLSPAPGSEALRPRAQSALPGFFFAGDWTRTGFPATIESAVASGHRAADLIIAERRHAEI